MTSKLWNIIGSVALLLVVPFVESRADDCLECGILENEIVNWEGNLATLYSDYEFLEDEELRLQDEVDGLASILAAADACIGIFAPMEVGGDFPDAEVLPPQLTTGEQDAVNDFCDIYDFLDENETIMDRWNSIVAVHGAEAEAVFQMWFSDIVDFSNVQMTQMMMAQADLEAVQDDMVEKGDEIDGTLLILIDKYNDLSMLDCEGCGC